MRFIEFFLSTLGTPISPYHRDTHAYPNALVQYWKHKTKRIRSNFTIVPAAHLPVALHGRVPSTFEDANWSHLLNHLILLSFYCKTT